MLLQQKKKKKHINSIKSYNVRNQNLDAVRKRSNYLLQLMFLEMGMFITIPHWVGSEAAAWSFKFGILLAAVFRHSHAALLSETLCVSPSKFLAPEQQTSDGVVVDPVKNGMQPDMSEFTCPQLSFRDSPGTTMNVWTMATTANTQITELHFMVN